jgi:hypothetical protein
MLKPILSADSNSRGFDNMSDSELLAYFSRNNMFREDQNSPEWNRSFDRIRKRYGAPQPNPLTGLGADYDRAKDAQ